MTTQSSSSDARCGSAFSGSLEHPADDSPPPLVTAGLAYCALRRVYDDSFHYTLPTRTPSTRRSTLMNGASRYQPVPHSTTPASLPNSTPPCPPLNSLSHTFALLPGPTPRKVDTVG